MKTVFFDIDTQIDFLFPAGALYVPDSEKLLPVIAQLNQFAVSQGHLLISTTDAHSENDAEFQQWPPHCIAGTLGQRKPAITLTGKQASISTQPGQTGWENVTQILLEKQVLDCFSNPNLLPLLSDVNADRYVVYGVVTELCVQCASLGLLKTQSGKRVELVTDAIRSLSQDAERSMLAEFQQRGGSLTTAKQVFDS